MVDVIKALADYGIGIAVSVGIMVVLLRMVFPRLDKVDKTVADSSIQLQALTSAITLQAQTLTSLMKACEQAFNDNRETIKILLERREK